MRISVIGATGYTGEELLRILSGHPEAEIVLITSESSTGAEIHTHYPHLTRFQELALTSMKDIDTIAAKSDVVFLGLPHGHAMAVGKELYSRGVRIIDLGADYRFRNIAVYEEWYKVPHAHSDAPAVYGLTELFRDKVRNAKIVGNAGCYTTASILALAPLVERDLIELDTIIVDAKSGVSGAGRGLSLTSHFTEVFESVKAYNVGGHRHTPEIEEVLGGLAGQEITITFTPHLIPMARGILSTCYAKLRSGVDAATVEDAFTQRYGQEYFIRLLGQGGYPATKHTRGSNFCDIGWQIDARTGRIVVLSAIDNLVKGAAGQAVQNMNVMFGLDERMGLQQVPLYP